MKLSEAIRLGAMLRPQIKLRNRSELGTCAFGAAEDAAGMRMESIREWEWVQARRANECPVCGRGISIANVISEHLNDTHDWTRQQIADWVETIEPQPVAVEQGEQEEVCHGH